MVPVVSMTLATAGTGARAAESSTYGGPFQALELYASRGQNIHYCKSAWGPSHPGTQPAHCELISDLDSIRGTGSIVHHGEYIQVEFERGNLSLTELIDLWGAPQLAHTHGSPAGFQWELVAHELTVWMHWGDRHETPDRAILTLWASTDHQRVGPR